MANKDQRRAAKRMAAKAGRAPGVKTRKATFRYTKSKGASGGGGGRKSG